MQHTPVLPSLIQTILSAPGSHRICPNPGLAGYHRRSGIESPTALSPCPERKSRTLYHESWYMPSRSVFNRLSPHRILALCSCVFLNSRPMWKVQKEFRTKGRIIACGIKAIYTRWGEARDKEIGATWSQLKRATGIGYLGGTLPAAQIYPINAVRTASEIFFTASSLEDGAILPDLRSTSSTMPSGAILPTLTL